MSSNRDLYLYLDDLCRSGECNMLDASKYLRRAFDLPPQRAEEVLRAWIRIKQLEAITNAKSK